MRDKEIYKQQAAREILSFIEEICFSSAWIDFRVNQGSNGQRDFIINWIRNKYNIK